jgi:hypothetical protein
MGSSWNKKSGNWQLGWQQDWNPGLSLDTFKCRSKDQSRSLHLSHRAFEVIADSDFGIMLADHRRKVTNQYGRPQFALSPRVKIFFSYGFRPFRVVFQVQPNSKNGSRPPNAPRQ